jgi:hypothetical protein
MVKTRRDPEEYRQNCILYWSKTRDTVLTKSKSGQWLQNKGKMEADIGKAPIKDVHSGPSCK